MSDDAKYPVFGLYYRRYAPFDVFGRFTPATPLVWGHFQGDNRGPSTSTRDTSRTYGIIYFNRFGPIREFAGTSGTHFEPTFAREVVGYADVTHHLQMGKLNGPDQFNFRANTSGGNPLIPGSPDIDTYIDITFDFSSGDMVTFGTVYGDNFPSLEVFILCYRSQHAALLVDARAVNGSNSGPTFSLWGKNENSVIAMFKAKLELNSDGQMKYNYWTQPRQLAIPWCRMPAIAVTKMPV